MPLIQYPSQSPLCHVSKKNVTILDSVLNKQDLVGESVFLVLNQEGVKKIVISMSLFF